ncbi:hypothetical protein CLAFUW4_06818 [Fulvia fulva]|nr:uncharacterized protein CLAFUR5_20225 [Fulvia fulva]KAK4621626.1 hypothetical protein CLAFUR4_06826 [Fulvia fulva]KAK4622820.1 hypothetical protein CLAFUR0_06821 [Fulvia fulva]WMI38923.1 hypothetical protein CLAFUR5_20225 [Fulvia fulva]WPV15937.1 hypothetical protein CLAFUW4_06818 [Fulvia fulva]WPV30848.1 hypothetical protein CLAFUW7_06817 [Fulvia fulva]
MNDNYTQRPQRRVRYRSYRQDRAWVFSQVLYRKGVLKHA